MQISFGEVINQLVVMMLIISAGYAAKRFGVLDGAGDKTLAGVVANVTAPALIILSMSAVLDGKTLENVLVIAVIAVCAITLAFLASKLLGLFKPFQGEKGIIYRISVIFGNASFLGFPLCYGLFGKTGLLYASIYSAVQDTFFWSLGVSMMADKKGGRKFKNFLNPSMIAIFIGFVLLLGGIRVPQLAERVFTTVGNATIPLALMLVGSGFYKVDLGIRSLGEALIPCVIKLLAIPAAAGAVLYLLNIDTLVKYVILLELSMPSAASGVFLAKNYDKDYRLASKVVMTMTVLSMLTIPLIVLAVRGLL